MGSHEYYERRARIETPRLWLRPMREEDAELIVAWRNEPSTAAMFFIAPPTLDEHLRWFHSGREWRVDYVIVRKEEGRPIGVVNFRDIDEVRGVAEGGKLIGDLNSRGRGMAKEAFAAWLMYGFGTLGLRRVMIRTRTDNTANIRINEKLGFHVEERYRHRAADGVVREFVMMTLPRREVDRRPYFRSVDRQGYFDKERSDRGRA